MAGRSLRLHARGLIPPPPRQRASVNGSRNRRPVAVAGDMIPLQVELAAVQPLAITPLRPGSPERALLQGLLPQHHYLGHRNWVGENLTYLVRAAPGRPLACVLFGSAAWQCQPRDAFIGWRPEQRWAGLARLTNKHAFPHSALGAGAAPGQSRLEPRVSAVTPRLAGEGGHPIELVETFVERERFAGTCYRAAGWTRVGAIRLTSGTNSFYDLQTDPFEGTNLLSGPLTTEQQQYYDRLQFWFYGYSTNTGPRITSAAWTNGQFSCTLTQAASYALWRCDDLTTTFWSPVTNAVATTNGSTVTLTRIFHKFP